MTANTQQTISIEKMSRHLYGKMPKKMEIENTKYFKFLYLSLKENGISVIPSGKHPGAYQKVNNGFIKL